MTNEKFTKSAKKNMDEPRYIKKRGNKVISSELYKI